MSTLFQQVAAALNWFRRVNENFISVSPSGLYGIDPATTTGLTLGYLGGNFNGAVIGTSTVLMTASNTNYVVAHRTTGAVTAATTTTNWLDTTTYLQLYQVVAGASTMTSIDDFRQSYGGTGSGGGGASDMLSVLTAAEIAVTTTATLTFGRMHVCSGTSADYTVTLPAVSGNAGKFLGVRIAAACTRWITVDGNSSELIDGALTRMMWANETAILFCDGSAWTKVSGKTIPIKAAMTRAGVFSMPSGTWTAIPADTTLYDNTSGLATPAANTGTGRIAVLRPGEYQFSGRVSIVGITSGRIVACGAAWGTAADMVGGSGPNTPGAWSAAPASSGGVASGFAYGSGSALAVVGATHFFYCYSFLDDTANRNTNTGPDTCPFLTVLEVPSW